MKSPRQMPREQLMFAAVLILLSLLTVLLWLNDPNRRVGQSRIDWPPHAKP